MESGGLRRHFPARNRELLGGQPIPLKQCGSSGRTRPRMRCWCGSVWFGDRYEIDRGEGSRRAPSAGRDPWRGRNLGEGSLRGDSTQISTACVALREDDMTPEIGPVRARVLPPSMGEEDNRSDVAASMSQRRACRGRRPAPLHGTAAEPPRRSRGSAPRKDSKHARFSQVTDPPLSPKARSVSQISEQLLRATVPFTSRTLRRASAAMPELLLRDPRQRRTPVTQRLSSSSSTRAPGLSPRDNG